VVPGEIRGEYLVDDHCTLRLEGHIPQHGKRAEVWGEMRIGRNQRVLWVHRVEGEPEPVTAPCSGFSTIEEVRKAQQQLSALIARLKPPTTEEAAKAREEIERRGNAVTDPRPTQDGIGNALSVQHAFCNALEAIPHVCVSDIVDRRISRPIVDRFVAYLNKIGVSVAPYMVTRYFNGTQVADGGYAAVADRLEEETVKRTIGDPPITFRDVRDACAATKQVLWEGWDIRFCGLGTMEYGSTKLLVIGVTAEHAEIKPSGQPRFVDAHMFAYREGVDVDELGGQGFDFFACALKNSPDGPDISACSEARTRFLQAVIEAIETPLPTDKTPRIKPVADGTDEIATATLKQQEPGSQCFSVIKGERETTYGFELPLGDRGGFVMFYLKLPHDSPFTFDPDSVRLEVLPDGLHLPGYEEGGTGAWALTYAALNKAEQEGADQFLMWLKGVSSVSEGFINALERYMDTWQWVQDGCAGEPPHPDLRP